jgi:uncharacterized protein
MQNVESRLPKIEDLAIAGDTEELQKLFKSGYTVAELNTALDDAISYSQIQTAEYLISLGADFSFYGYNGVYYAAHNNELEGLKFAIAKGVDINFNNGILLNTGIVTAMNTKSVQLVGWLLENGANPSLITKQSLKMVDDFGNEELKTLLANAT